MENQEFYQLARKSIGETKRKQIFKYSLIQNYKKKEY